MSQNFKIKIGRTHLPNEDGPHVRINLSISFAEDTPPALAAAIMERIGKLLAAGTDEETATQIHDELIEIRERKQRQADHAARLLIGESDPGENGRHKEG